MTARSEVPHMRGTYPTIRELLASGLGSRSRTPETPGRGSITIREVHNPDAGGQSCARE